MKRSKAWPSPDTPLIDTIYTFSAYVHCLYGFINSQGVFEEMRAAGVVCIADEVRFQG